MENKKASTLAQRFGFQDPELKTPKHDGLMIWLDENVGAWFAQWGPVVGFREELSEMQQDYSLQRYSSVMPESVTQIDAEHEKYAVEHPLGEIEHRIDKVWEQPIMNDKYMIGFADMFVTYSLRRANAHICRRYDGTFGASSREHSFSALFEVKPSLPSAGELIRQIRMYEKYTKSPWFIVSPDTRFRSVIEGQGIGFINPSEFEQGSLFT